MTTVAITGCSGYLGGFLINDLTTRGLTCIALRRGVDWPGFALQNSNKYDFHGVEALIHCAWNFSPGHEITSSNGSDALFQAAHRQGIRTLINISSMSAYAGCKSKYGKAKLSIENVIQKLCGHSIRCGLLWHDEIRGGILSKITDQILNCRILPIIGNGNYPQFTTNLNDLSVHICRVISDPKSIPSIHSLIAEPPMSFNSIIDEISAGINHYPHRAHVPWRILYLAAYLCESIGLTLPFRSDSVIGLVYSTDSPLNPVEHPMTQFHHTLRPQQ